MRRVRTRAERPALPVLLLALLAAHARALHRIGIAVFAVDALLMALLVAAAVAVLLRPLPGRWAAAASALVAAVLLAGGGRLWILLGASERDPGGFGFDPGFTSLREGTGSVVVLLLGLLPVVAAGAWRPGRSRPLSRPLRALAVACCALTALVVLRDLERALALRDLVRGLSQELGLQHALTGVAALWTLSALVLCAAALRHPRVRPLAALLPVGLAALWGRVLLADPPRYLCCFTYSSGPYEEPPLLPDLLLVAGVLVVGLLPLAVQLRRVSTSASTPPG